MIPRLDNDRDANVDILISTVAFVPVAFVAWRLHENPIKDPHYFSTLVGLVTIIVWRRLPGMQRTGEMLRSIAGIAGSIAVVIGGLMMAPTSLCLSLFTIYTGLLALQTMTK